MLYSYSGHWKANTCLLHTIKYVTRIQGFVRVFLFYGVRMNDDGKIGFNLAGFTLGVLSVGEFNPTDIEVIT